ncbi:hypothetical protein SDC9_184814 [bioreactor metagenome]|uniref:Uncharacterized protein n=1 Tax=bioreactor metagenome TaxID=1076179 RepID=A0A645HE35_9ZZZZ
MVTGLAPFDNTAISEGELAAETEIGDDEETDSVAETGDAGAG